MSTCNFRYCERQYYAGCAQCHRGREEGQSPRRQRGPVIGDSWSEVRIKRCCDDSDVGLVPLVWDVGSGVHHPLPPP